MSQVNFLVRSFRVRLLGNFFRDAKGHEMTENGNFKRRVRARAGKTGESYTAALRHIRKSEAVDFAPKSKSFRLAVAQTSVCDDPRDISALRASGREVRRLMHEAHRAQARLVQFPEGTICSPNKRIMSDDPGAAGAADWTRFKWEVLREELEATRLLARELSLWTIFGSVHQLSQPHRPHNSLYVVSDRGELVTRYDERLLSNTKISFMYSPGAVPITFEIDDFRFGCALGMEAHFPEVFSEYERLDVDCVLFSTTHGTASFAAEMLGHAASNPYWVSLSAHADSRNAPSGIGAPDGQWVAQCMADGTPSVTVFAISKDPENLARPWRRKVRAGIYQPHMIDDDPRSTGRDMF